MKPSVKRNSILCAVAALVALFLYGQTDSVPLFLAVVLLLSLLAFGASVARSVRASVQKSERANSGHRHG